MPSRLITLLLILLLLAGCDNNATSSDVESQDTGDTDIQNSVFTSPINDMTAATLTLNAPFEKVFISPLADSDNLIEAEVEHLGEMIFTTEADTITLREDANGINYDEDKPLRWNVLLSPDPALALNLQTASGELTLDASNLSLSSLVLESRSGTIDADLPALPAPMMAEVETVSGTITVNMPDSANVDFSRVDVSSGEVSLNIGEASNVTITAVEVASGRVVVDVPTGTAVRLEVQEVASGSVNIAYAMTRLTGSASDEGIWETDNYEDAENRVTILVTRVSSGTFALE